jgi:polysaccharide export outer membrane protein
MKPGALMLLPAMTALQAISSCGGFTQFARPNKTYILRTEEGKQKQIPFSYKEVLKGRNSDVSLQSGDVIVAP